MIRLWNSLTATLILAFAGWLLVSHLVPASFWFEVRSVEIPDTVADATPVLIVDRSIHRGFDGTYTVDVERQMPSGHFAVVCSARNSTNYRADAELPDPLTLDWWTWPVECKVAAGTYRVETVWRISPELFPDKLVSNMSNTFTISPADTLGTAALPN